MAEVPPWPDPQRTACSCCDPRGGGPPCAPCEVIADALTDLADRQGRFVHGLRRLIDDVARESARTLDDLLALHKRAHDALGPEANRGR